MCFYHWVECTYDPSAQCTLTLERTHPRLLPFVLNSLPSFVTLYATFTYCFVGNNSVFPLSLSSDLFRAISLVFLLSHWSSCIPKFRLLSVRPFSLPFFRPINRCNGCPKKTCFSQKKMIFLRQHLEYNSFL